MRKKKAKLYSIRFNVSLDSKTYNEFENYCFQLGFSKSSLARHLIKSYLDTVKENQKDT